MKNRTLYFGDNLEILQKKIADETFDLIYLDPPFNSKKSYNVLFKEGLQDSPAQVKAFEDSWHWNRESKETFDYLVTRTNADIANLMQALEKIIGHNDMMAYLTMMAVRLKELYRVLKDTGSLYLHCDPTASHYLKIVLDVIFGKNNFRDEIIWKRSGGFKRSSANKFPTKHDVILFYSKTENYSFNPQFRPHKPEYLKRFKRDEKGRLYRDDVNPTKGGRRVIYLDEVEGDLVDSVWSDIPPVNPAGSERLGYPTQKPEALLERIIKASSDDGQWILDPFCGCGTTVSVAEKLKRNWVGVDVTSLAINLIKRRLKDQFGLGSKQIIVDGLPTDITGARELFKKDPFEFEYWALDLVEAVPSRSKSKENMRGADKGIDGVIFFVKDYASGNGSGNDKKEYGKILVQVKGGSVQRRDIATLRGDVDREKADGGLFITLERPTRPMVQEAIDSGDFTTPITGKMEFPKIQILTVEELLTGKKPNLPQGLVKSYHKEAKYTEINNSNQGSLLGL